MLWVPLHDLTAPGTFREEWWHTDLGERPIYFFELDDETVWGATARHAAPVAAGGPRSVVPTTAEPPTL